ncbi:MAG: 4Fe-4S dicluster domain-containing protein [Candidatus Neomarinimicrobiota bacterium]|nr:MAG: 4Fe-4S dicluster domain-containing protein [Candidatus Neomarinimicrobiota bacterium]
MRERRELLQKIGSGVFASLLMSPLMATPIKEALTAPDTTQKLTSLPEVPEGQPDEDPIIRMVRDLKRALQKPMEERKWSMVIDLRKCVGCHACTVGCIAENKLPPGVVYRPVLEEEIGTFPHVARRFIPRPCMQCEEPPCTTVCPVNATWKRKDGIVEIDYDQCIGCRYCITACPYSARTFDTGHYYTEDAPSQPAGYLGSADARVYETAPNYDYGQERPRVDEQSPIGNARKCHFCVHRLEKGMLPECVVTCIGRATFFGDANDPESLVSELIPQPNVMRLKEEMGTKPKVHYLM